MIDLLMGLSGCFWCPTYVELLYKRAYYQIAQQTAKTVPLLQDTQIQHLRTSFRAVQVFVVSYYNIYRNT